MKKINYFIYRFKYHYARLLNLKNPVDVAIELSSRCNLKCPYCYHGVDDKCFKESFMDIKTAYLIIDQLALHKVNSIKFNWRGESLLHKDAAHILYYAYATFIANKKKNVLIDRILNTNFNMHIKDHTFRSLNLLTKLKISIDSMRPSIYMQQRKGGSFERIKDNIDTYFNDYWNGKTKVVLQAVRTYLNQDEDLHHEFKKRWPYAIISIRDCVDNRNDSNCRINIDAKRIPCKQAFSRLIFDHNGNAYPCCPAYDDNKNFELRYGNIYNNDLSELFNSNEAVELRRKLVNGQAFNHYMLCKDCSSHESYSNHKGSWDS